LVIARMRGNRILAAVVDERSDAIIPSKNSIKTRRIKNGIFDIIGFITSVIILRSPEIRIASPRDIPPPNNIKVDHLIELKSSVVRIPLPKNQITGIRAIIPLCPNTETTQSPNVHRNIVTNVIAKEI